MPRAVLKLDVDCEKLALNLQRERMPLQGPFTAFLHKALRKVAAHYGLAVEAAPELGGMVLCRTGATRIPATRLQDLPGPRPSDEEGPHAGLGLTAAGPADAGAPRVVGVMRRSPSASGASDARAPAAPAGMSVEEREAAYERARERILGAATADAPAPDDGSVQQAVPVPQREDAVHQAAEAAAAERDAAADARRAAPAASGAAPPGGGGSSAQRRAVMRDREKDLADPDFARRAPPLQYGASGGQMGGAMGPGAYGFGQAPYGEAPYGYAAQQSGDYPPLGTAGRGGWSGGGGGGGYWPPLGGGGAAQGPYAAYAGVGRGQGAPVYGAYQGRGGGQQAYQGQDRGGW